MLKLKDFIYLSDRGILEEDIAFQIESLKKSNSFIKVLAPATSDNGILVIKNPDEYIKLFDLESGNYNICKFVPASGAATRMFKRLIAFYNNPEKYDIKEGGFYSVENTFKNIDKFAFYQKLKNSCNIDDRFNMTGNVLYNCLNYSNTPKGLIDFHKYENDVRTPFEEHACEAIAMCDNPIKIHLTISEEFYNGFETELNKIKAKLNSENLEVTFSFQDQSTDTLAVYDDGNIVRNDDGSLLLRPGGHGSLIHNLNRLDSDIIFIKNIDNVVHASMLDGIISYKKVLGGLLIDIKDKVKDLYTKLSNNEQSAIPKTKEFLNETFGVDISKEAGFKSFMQALNKPIRVCGMVKNTGEPGGGPFWVNKNNVKSLQIIEKAQIDFNSPQQIKQFELSTHFNPVDLVCYNRNPEGETFDLDKYVDKDANFVSEKTFNGKPIRVMEHPGLWNGAMAEWLTVFVEVPLVTFNPVKEINDLLRKEHLGNI